MATIIIKSGTTSIQGATVKGSFSYFSGSTIELGPTSSTGFYSGIDAPEGGYTVYTTGGPSGFNITLASDTTQLNTRLISLGAPYGNVNDNITWASSNNAIYINSNPLSLYYFGGQFTATNVIQSPYVTLLNSGGTQDTSFNIGTGFNAQVYSVAIQSDGKVLVGGNYGTFSGASQIRLIRLNTDGSKDTSFNIGTGFNAQVYSVAVQSDGKVLVGGLYTTFTGATQFRLIRLNTDGSKDTSFNIGTGFNGNINSIAVQSDGKVLAGGSFTTFNGSSQNYLIRLNTDGSKDTSFNIGTGFNTLINSVAVQSDGKVLVGGNFTTFTGATQFRLIRLNTDGSKDTSFNIGSGPLGNVNSIAVQSDGKVLAGGSFTTFNGSSQNYLIRLNTDGSKDTSFNIGVGFGNTVYSVAVQSDGKVLVGGIYTTFTGATQNYLIRLNTDGSKDTSFNIGSGPLGNVNSIAVQSDGKVLAGGSFTTFNGSSQNYLIRLNTDGSKDTSFNIGIGFNNWVRSVAVHSNGKVLVGGDFFLFSGATQNRLIRLNTDGKDTSFNIGTGFGNNVVYSIEVQSDGKVLVGGGFTTFTGTTQNRLIRLNTDGSKDTSFNIGAGFNVQVYSIAVQSDGKVLAGGIFTTFNGSSQNYLIRLNTDGSKDTSFNIGTGFDNTVTSVAIQSDGKVLVGGNFTTFSGTTQIRLIRLNTDGSKDTSFNIGTGFNGPLNSVALQSDGKVLAGGDFTAFSGATQNRLIRLNTDGSKDTSFNIGTGFSGLLDSVALQSDGKVLAGGFYSSFSGATQFRLIRLNTDGSKDTSFNIGLGFNNEVRSVSVQSNGKVLVGGEFTSYQGILSSYGILLNSDGSISNNTVISFNNSVYSV